MTDKTRRAFIVIDMLNDFVRKGAPLEVPRARSVIPAIKQGISGARRRNEPVVYVCDAHSRRDREFVRFGWPPHAVKGTEGAAIVEELAPREGDLVVEKKTYSAFHRTSLERELKSRKVGRIRLAGCVTNICILFSASDAVLRGFEVEVDEGMVAGIDSKSHEFSLRQMETVLGVKMIRRGRR
jgi:nicotinamidase-related amidase